MRFLRDAVITLVVLVLVIWIAVYVRIRGGALSADAQPGVIERAAATRLVRLSIPADADRQPNPFHADASAWRSAVAHYKDHCAVCHGRDGRGKTDVGQNMYPRVPDLADAAVQTRSDGALFYIIQNGVRWTGMPSWKREHSAEDTWKLVSLIRKLPSLTPEELANLEQDKQAEPQAGRDKPRGHDHKHPDSHRKQR
jgi:mono/diheme cytochrome c family protein